MKNFVAALAGALLGAAIGVGPATSAPPVAAEPPAARDIAAFCGGRAACIGEQKVALKHFLGLWVWYDARDPDAERCMRAGKVGKYVDWVKAEACLRSWSKGRAGPFAKSKPGN